MGITLGKLDAIETLDIIESKSPEDRKYHISLIEKLIENNKKDSRVPKEITDEWIEFIRKVKIKYAEDLI